MYFCVVYLHQAGHLSFLKWCSDGGSEGLTVLYGPAFQVVFSCLVDVHLDHLPFELGPLRHQHLQTRSNTLQLMTPHILKTLKKSHNESSFNIWDFIHCSSDWTTTCCHSPGKAEPLNHPFHHQPTLCIFHICRLHFHLTAAQSCFPQCSPTLLFS